MMTRLWRRKSSLLPQLRLREAIERDSPLLRQCTDTELAGLYELAARLIDRVEITGAEDFRLSEEMIWRIAMEASLALRGPGLSACADWRTLVVFPDAFVNRSPMVDEFGVVHSGGEPLAGECWVNGPMVISWQDLLDSGPGYHVLIHEVAHRLDAGSGSMNGSPVLPPRVSQRQWAEVFSRAFDEHCNRVSNDQALAIDAYGAESPEEFFAVCCESYFTDYPTLAAWQPELAGLLERYFSTTDQR